MVWDGNRYVITVNNSVPIQFHSAELAYSEYRLVVMSSFLKVFLSAEERSHRTLSLAYI